tara:strand:- start:336 stop:815 length:480 start_codon:yes stop_codon:yes gene_type:complete
MADKKISALTAVADADIGGDDLLHIVDNPGGTPVNKKMTIAQLFENIPTHLAVDDITTLNSTAANLASSFATAIDLSGAGGNVAFTLDDGTDVGQIKLIYQKTEPASSHAANITVTSFGSGTSSSNQIVQDTLGDAVICIWDGSNWYILANFNSTITLS